MQKANPPFSEDIYNILSSNNESGFSIKAIYFSIPEDSDDDKFETIEYYYDGENRLNSKIYTEKRQLRDFTPDYIQELRYQKMREIVVVKLDFSDSGFYVLSNTKNRKFTNSDIEMILFSSKRIGLEIKHHQDTEKIKEQTKIIEQDENAKLIVHQIGAPVRAINGHAQNLDEKIYQEHEFPSKISQLYRMSIYLLRQINSLQKYLDWEIKPIFPKKESGYSLQGYIRGRAKQFEGLTVGTHIRIWTIIENNVNFYDSCYFDKSLFDEVLNCLLDNAVKYSFSRHEMSRNVFLFDPSDALSEGHIHIRLNSTIKRLELTVENYGCEIEEGEYETIFNRGTRGKYGKKRSPVGSGIGLYLAQKVVFAFKGKIQVFHDKNKFKTSFKVTLSHEQ
ncbi:MAG: hypothetical protein IPL31_07990 [Saprospiraceae bacterium]|nr:hypothetical protein [Saprospiraceae bacterium]